eukprot:g1391.t1
MNPLPSCCSGPKASLVRQGFNILLKAYNFVRPLRAKGQNVVASLLMVNDADGGLDGSEAGAFRKLSGPVEMVRN